VQSGENPEFWRVEYDVGASTGPEDALVRHGGSEYGYVLFGRLGVKIGSESFELAAGDSVSFNSENPHRLWTIGNRPVLAMWIVFSCSKVRVREKKVRRAPRAARQRTNATRTKQLVGVKRNGG
jgi:quercetin dioxygenase-like cupin family protein